MLKTHTPRPLSGLLPPLRSRSSGRGGRGGRGFFLLPLVALTSLTVLTGGCERPHSHDDEHGPNGSHTHAGAKATTPTTPTTPTTATTTTTTAATAPHGHDHGAAAAYGCPMDADVKSDKPGRCPKCGMDLVALAADARTFDMRVTTTPAPAAGQPTTLSFRAVDDKGVAVTAFDVVHEKKLHLLMASKDLSWFAHEHPELQSDGSFTQAFTFPQGGDYWLYSDFRPTGARGQVVKKPITVTGTAAPAKALVVDDLSKAKSIAGHQVRLQASTLAAGATARLDFTLVKDGKPVTDLSPYLGAMGHCVILSEDGSEFLHSHPEDGDHAHDHAAGTGEHAHAKLPGQVTFHTTFPRPGLYKIWGQFLHGQEMVIADFVVNISK
jgi:hypothetical protein